MAEVLLFHHAHGLTPGCAAFAETLRAAGHVVHIPDLYEGRTFDTLADGVAHAEGLGMETVIERGERAAEGLPHAIVYAGFSLGALPAQKLAQRRPGAKGALLLHACVPAAVFGPWPPGVPLQIHTMEADEWVDLDEARELARTAPDGELFSYPGAGHLFADESLPGYDAGAAALLERRVLAFLAGAS